MSTEPPHNPQAEEYLLATCLIDGPGVLSRCIASGLNASMFYRPANRLIFSRLQSMLADGKPIELVSLETEMRHSRELDQVGGMAYLIQISGTVPTTSQVGLFVNVIRETYLLREILKTATATIDAVNSYAGQGVNDVLAEPLTRLLALSANQTAAREPDWKAVVEQAEWEFESILAMTGRPADQIIEFPWESANKVFEPMQRGQLVIVAARPSVGKSSLLRPVAFHAAKHGKRIYMATLEVKAYRVALQMASSQARIGLKDAPRAHARDKDEFRQSFKKMKTFDIHISNSDRSMAQIVARAKSVHAQKPLDLLVIDYLGLIEDCDKPMKNETKASAVGRVTKTLKRLAGELNCVVLVAAQLNRSSAADDNREPRLTDLRDSGDIEQDADKVLLIHRPGTDEITKLPQADTDAKAERPRFYQKVIQAKGRDDGTGIVAFYFTRATASFEQISR